MCFPKKKKQMLVHSVTNTMKLSVAFLVVAAALIVAAEATAAATDDTDDADAAVDSGQPMGFGSGKLFWKLLYIYFGIEWIVINPTTTKKKMKCQLTITI